MISGKLNILYKDSNKQEKVRCLVDRWTFQDKAMSIGEQFITFTIVSQVPIPFAVGDYCIYRGVYFFLNNLPSVDQTAKPKKAGDAFKYDGVRFDSVSNDLGRVTMLDITPTTGDYVAAMGTNYTGSATFQLFCGETRAVVLGKTVVYTPVCTLAGKIQANLDRAFPEDGWHIHVNLSSTEIKKGVTQLVTHTEDKVLTFNNTTVAAALAEVQSTFQLDYFVRGRDIYIGYTLGAVTSDQSTIDETSANREYFYFGYGKGYADKDNQGKALFEVKRVANPSQQIITRLRAMGSTKNMPYRFYNKRYNLSQSLFPQNLQLPDTFETPEVKAKKNIARKAKNPYLRAVLGDTNDAYIDKNDDCMSTKEGLREGAAQWDGSNKDLEEIYPTIKRVTYGELRTAECEDMKGRTEAKGGATDANGHKSFLNYEDAERVDEILAVGYLVDGKIVDNANSGNGIVPQEGSSYPYIDKDAKINEISINGASTQKLGEQNYIGEKLLFEIKDQGAGSYFMAASFGHVWAGIRYISPNGGSVEAAYRINIYIKPKSTNIEFLASSYTSPKQVVKRGETSFLEFELPHLPDVVSDNPQVRAITLTEPSDIRVTFEFILYRRIYNGNNFTVSYFVGKSKNATDVPTNYKPQYRWAEAQYANYFLNTPFNVIVKDLGIKDWRAQFNGKDKPMLVMSDGRCVAREFEIGADVKSIKYIKDGKEYDAWQLRLTRANDTSIHVYYPNSKDQLQAGDHFVLTGIVMPEVYIKAAEVRLLIAATQYLADNCETKYTYEPHLDDIYLARNYDKCDAQGDVKKSVYWNLYAGLRFPFLGIPETSDDQEILPIINITIESLTIKEGEGLIPKVELTLNDKIEQSTYKKITTAVDRIYNGSLFSQLGIGGGLSASDVTMLIRKIGDAAYISKTASDTAQEIITFLKGLKFGNGEYGIDKDGLAKLDAIHIGEYVEGVSGAALKEINGQTYLEVDRAYFRQKAVFESLEVMKTEYSYGNRIAGKGGVKITQVEEQPNAYRCYFLHEQDGLKIENPFVLNDQAIVREVNIKAGTTEHATNHFLWRAVVAVGENYVDLSKTVCASGSDKPLPGDALCQLGYRGTDKPDRQCAIMERTVGEDVPAYVMLQGINDFTLEGKDILSYGWDATKKRAYMRNYGETYVGSRDKKQFIEYTPENGLRVNAKEVNVEVKGQPTSVGQTMSEIATKTDEISLTVKNRKFGGVNLLKETAFDKLPKRNPARLSIGNDPAVCHSGRNYIKASASGFSNNSFTGIFLYASQVERNTEYTYSVWVRVDDLSALDGGLYFEVFATKGADGTRVADIVGKFLMPPDAGKWVRVVNTFTTPNIDFDALEITAFVIKNGTAYFSEPQLEVGNVPTDWSENPDDVKNQIEETGVKIKQGLIELNGKSVFKNGNAPAVPLFDENGKVNPKLSTAQYLMNVLRSMETMIDGGLVIAGLMAAKDGEQVTAYLNGLRQKTHALAAGVKNFGTENETTVSHINFDGSAKFGNLGISADGRVNIIDAAGKPRINITPDELPSDDELLKTADEDKTYNLPEIHWGPNNDDNWTTPQVSQTFNISNDNSAVTLKILMRIGSTLIRDFTDGEANNASCVLRLRNLTRNYEQYIAYYGAGYIVVENNIPKGNPNMFGRSIIETIRISKSFMLGAGNWQIVAEPGFGENVYANQLSMSQISIDVSFKSGRQNFSLAHNGFASVNSNHQAAYIRDGKLHAFGEMNIPGILLAGSVSSGGYLSNAWGEFAAGTGLTYNDAGGVRVIRLTFNKKLPCGSNYVVSVVPNEDGAVYGCMAVIRRKTEKYCEFRIVNDSGGEVGGVGLDFIVVGRNK